MAETPNNPYVCVPVEPTIDMEIEATEAWLVHSGMEERSAQIWKAMLAASPNTHSPVENELLKKAIELLHANGDRMTAQLLESALLPK